MTIGDEDEKTTIQFRVVETVDRIMFCTFMTLEKSHFVRVYFPCMTLHLVTTNLKFSRSQGKNPVPQAI